MESEQQIESHVFMNDQMELRVEEAEGRHPDFDFHNRVIQG